MLSFGKGSSTEELEVPFPGAFRRHPEQAKLFPVAQAPTSHLPFESRAARQDAINRLTLIENPLLKASTSSAYFMWYPVEPNSLLPSATGVFQEEKGKKKRKKDLTTFLLCCFASCLFSFYSVFFLNSLKL